MVAIVNLTHPAVVRAVEDVLEQCPVYPYQQAFAHPALRQRLIAYVLNRSQNRFTLIENNAETNQSLNAQVLEEYDRIRAEHTVIHSEIEGILRDHSDWIERHVHKQQYISEQQKLL